MRLHRPHKLPTLQLKVLVAHMMLLQTMKERVELDDPEEGTEDDLEARVIRYYTYIDVK